MTFDIVRYPIPLGASTYPRPCIIIDPDTLDMMPLTTKPYARFNYFTIHSDHEDFNATGLSATSYVLGDTIARAEPSVDRPLIGRLTGELSKEFAK